MRALPKHLALTLCCAAILCYGAGAPGEDEELMTAGLARATSLEFALCMDAFEQAQADRDAAIAAIPDIQAIDQELARLANRIQVLHRLRQAVIKQHQVNLEAHELRLEMARDALAAADPIQQLLVQRRILVAESQTEAETE